MAIVTSGRHPVTRYAVALVCIAAALSTILVSTLINPHSASWLVALYTTAGIFIVSIKQRSSSPVQRSFNLYVLMLTLYLSVVWTLHVLTPERDPERVKAWIGPLTFIGYFGVIYNAIALLHFTIHFSAIQSKVVKIAVKLGWLVSTGFLMTHFAGHFAGDYTWMGQTWVPALAGGYGYFFPFTTVLLTASLLLPLWRFVFTADHQLRLRLFFYLLGAIPVWMSCWGNFLLSIGTNIYTTGGLFFIWHAVVIGYAVLRRGVFDVTIVVRRGFAFALCSVLIGFTYAMLMLLLLQLAPAVANGIIPTILFVSATSLAYAPLLNHLQRWVDGFFFRAVVDRERLMDVFSKEAASSIDLEVVTCSLCQMLDKALQPRAVTIYLADEAGQLKIYGIYLQQELRLSSWPDSELASQEVVQAAENPDLAVRIDRPAHESKNAGVVLQGGTEAIVQTMMHGNRLLGCIVLDPKIADEAYSVDDARFLKTAAAQSTLALLHARSFAGMKHLQALTSNTFQALAAGVLVIEQSGQIVQANSAALRIFGCDNASATNLGALWERQPILGSALRRALETGTPQHNQELTLEGPRTISILLTLQSLGEEEHGKQLWLAVFHDISDYKQMKMLAERRENLARVGEAISTINHEIKNLLQPIQFQVRALAALDEEGIKRNPEVLRRAMTIIPERMTALDGLLANLRDLARPIELRKRKINLHDLIVSVFNDLQDAKLCANIELRNDISPSTVCFGDGQWLRQVLFNLIRNAVEAASNSTQACVSVVSCQIHDEMRIAITDNGCGMDEAMMRRLFQPFVSTKGQSGTGLGLCLSRKIIELHDGKIEVESRPSKGTTFTILLPNNVIGV